MSLTHALVKLAWLSGGLVALILTGVWLLLYSWRWFRAPRPPSRTERKARRDVGMAPRHPEHLTAELSDADEVALAELADLEGLDDITDAVFGDLRGGAL